MDADKKSLPAYARRGVILRDPRSDWTPAILLVGNQRLWSTVFWEDFLQPLLRRMNPRKRS